MPIPPEVQEFIDKLGNSYFVACGDINRIFINGTASGILLTDLYSNADYHTKACNGVCCSRRRSIGRNLKRILHLWESMYNNKPISAKYKALILARLRRFNEDA